MDPIEDSDEEEEEEVQTRSEASTAETDTEMGPSVSTPHPIPNTVLMATLPERTLVHLQRRRRGGGRVQQCAPSFELARLFPSKQHQKLHVHQVLTIPSGRVRVQ